MFISELKGADVTVYNEEKLLIIIDGYEPDMNLSVSAEIEIQWSIDLERREYGVKCIYYNLISYTGTICIELDKGDEMEEHYFQAPNDMTVIFELKANNNGIAIENVEIDLLKNTITLTNG